MAIWAIRRTRTCRATRATTSIGDTLAASGGSTTCTFVGVFNGVAGDSETDTVTVVGTDTNGNTATDDDDAS